MPVSRAGCVKARMQADFTRERYKLCENEIRTGKKAAAIEALIKQGVPELEALQQVEKLTCEFGLNRIRQKCDAFLMRHQMNYPNCNMNPGDKASERVNLQDPNATVKAFDEAFEQLLQASSQTAAIMNCQT